ncbi:MAG TPA: D-alanine--D-alanine ligase [Tepidisphaeraceae bacterium]|jgi:D-alanine-D-alanine ligase
MRVTVLYGGPSAEREVSLVSGKAVIEGLKAAGHEVFGSDVSPADLSGLDRSADVIFPVLHGEFGESGELQEILEQRQLPFVGSGSKASRLGMDKIKTKQAWEQAGLSTPPWRRLDASNPNALEQVGAPCVVKAISSGSSIDVFVCKTMDEAKAACDKIRARHDAALIEKFIQGPELTVGLLEEKPLAPIRIVPKRGFFDFEAKYKAADTEHRFETGLPAEVVERCRELAREANDVVGARDLARIDIMLDDQHHPHLLEINTLPGFTPKSLLPEAANHAGINFTALVDRLVKRASERGARG